MTSALLQLPLTMSKREKQQRVVAIIDQLVRRLLSGTCDHALSIAEASGQHSRRLNAHFPLLHRSFISGMTKVMPDYVRFRHDAHEANSRK